MQVSPYGVVRSTTVTPTTHADCSPKLSVSFGKTFSLKKDGIQDNLSMGSPFHKATPAPMHIVTYTEGVFTAFL